MPEISSRRGGQLGLEAAVERLDLPLAPTQLAEEARVLERDRRLLGEVEHQPDVVLVEGPLAQAVVDVDRAAGAPLDDERAPRAPSAGAGPRPRAPRESERRRRRRWSRWARRPPRPAARSSGRASNSSVSSVRWSMLRATLTISSPLSSSSRRKPRSASVSSMTVSTIISSRRGSRSSLLSRLLMRKRRRSRDSAAAARAPACRRPARRRLRGPSQAASGWLSRAAR